MLIALDSYRTVGQGIQNVRLIVLVGHGHKADTDGARRKACPSSSEVLADIVRRRACPSSSEVPTGSCEEEGRGANPSSSEVPGDEQEGYLENVRKRAVCNPSSSEVPTAVAEEAAGLGGWGACLPTPSGSDEKRTTMVDVNNHRSTKRNQEFVEQLASKHSGLRTQKRQLTCTSNVTQRSNRGS